MTVRGLRGLGGLGGVGGLGALGGVGGLGGFGYGGLGGLLGGLQTHLTAKSVKAKRTPGLEGQTSTLLMSPILMPPPCGRKTAAQPKAFPGR